MEVTVPIAPQVEKGTIFVKIECASQISRQNFDIDVEILVRARFYGPLLCIVN